MPSAPPPRPAVQPHVGNGQHVVILGAGMAGMAAAYELQRSGYTCTVLEAQGRPGGRCWTVRRGTTAAEVDGPGQMAYFDSGRYMNAGPARIPQHHETTIAYCREFGLALNVVNNDNESAYYYLDGEGPLADRPIRAREVETDLKGETADAMADLDLDERQARALEQGGKIHPQYEHEFETSFSVAWHKLPFHRGGWARYTEETRATHYPTLVEPDGPIYLAGDHTSYLTGWMAGAFESAHRVVDALHARVVSAN